MHIPLIELATFYTYGDHDDQIEDYGDVTIWCDEDRKIYAVQWWEPDRKGVGQVRRYQTMFNYADAIESALRRTGWGSMAEARAMGEEYDR